MEFFIEMCAMLTMKSEKRETMEGNQETIKTLGEKENYNYLEAKTI